MKVAVITGSTKGIGRAIAEMLAKDGFAVVVSARNQKEVEQTVVEMKGSGATVEGRACDVRSNEQVEALIAHAVSTFGGIDVLVNNAGVGRFGTVAEMSPEVWREVLETNLNGVFYACHAAIPHLRQRGGGYIFNISSLAGKNAFPQGGAYNASKFGLNGFSEVLFQEVRYDNIRVSCIMPGSVSTYFNNHTPIPEDEWKLQPEDIAQVVLDLLHHHPRSLPSAVEIRPAKPRKG
ncbi:MAG: SDR family oxidoreductase [Blastocatellia bacterium]|nr:SDR family oxidoreductase [Blastocatellia bacterium]